MQGKNLVIDLLAVQVGKDNNNNNDNNNNIYLFI